MAFPCFWSTVSKLLLWFQRFCPWNWAMPVRRTFCWGHVESLVAATSISYRLLVAFKWVCSCKNKKATTHIRSPVKTGCGNPLIQQGGGKTFQRRSGYHFRGKPKWKKDRGFLLLISFPSSRTPFWRHAFLFGWVRLWWSEPIIREREGVPQSFAGWSGQTSEVYYNLEAGGGSDGNLCKNRVLHQWFSKCLFKMCVFAKQSICTWQKAMIETIKWKLQDSVWLSYPCRIFHIRSARQVC